MEELRITPEDAHNRYFLEVKNAGRWPQLHVVAKSEEAEARVHKKSEVWKTKKEEIFVILAKWVPGQGTNNQSLIILYYNFLVMIMLSDRLFLVKAFS